MLDRDLRNDKPNLADRTEGDTMDGKDLAAVDAPPAHDDTETLPSTSTSDVLRRFDQGTTLVTSVAAEFRNCCGCRPWMLSQRSRADLSVPVGRSQ